MVTRAYEFSVIVACEGVSVRKPRHRRRFAPWFAPANGISVDRYDLTSLSDDAVDLEWDRSVDNDRSSTADMLARLAEYDARQLYRRAGYASMYAYCLGAKNFSESSARKRIHAARTARQFPALFVA